ncbi:FTR1 family protein, partial [Nostoc sp. 'Peltigera malacea cyanobiont' DB3992]|uniref:FTR1 family protein n=1 Tax=Nostoc sp. 'Peltigera malacea cyanobiont' DB3992 TaxID=1206980 RepID=UPI000C063D5B
LQSQIETAIQSGDKWGTALVGMSFFAVLREGLETVVFLLATFQQNLGNSSSRGGIVWICSRTSRWCRHLSGWYPHQLEAFFKWTGAFIILVAAGLLASGVRAFHEAGVWNLLQTVVFDASGYFPRTGFSVHF